MKKAHQDGADFYDSETGKVLATYKDLCKNDYDMKGAKAAREQFLHSFPDYQMDEDVP